jgi:hypothetical protein
MIPHFVEIDDHVGSLAIVADPAHKITLGRLSTIEVIYTNWRVAVFDDDALCRCRARNREYQQTGKRGGRSHWVDYPIPLLATDYFVRTQRMLR